MSAFLSVRCSVPWALEEELPNLLSELPVLGTEIGERQGGSVEITVFLTASERLRAADVESVLRSNGGNSFVIGTLEEEDWLENFRQVVQPFAVGETWWVDPHPDTPAPAPANRIRLVIPPRMAFGSGSHESTRLVLESFDAIDLRGQAVFDVGTGSGILALAADALGASHVLAVDIDPYAVHIATQIRDLQEWRPSVHYLIGSAGCARRGFFDKVVCNMISANMVPLLDGMTMALAPGGVLMLSGLLGSEVRELSAQLRHRNLEIEATLSLGEWASVRARRCR